MEKQDKEPRWLIVSLVFMMFVIGYIAYYSGYNNGKDDGWRMGLKVADEIKSELNSCNFKLDCYETEGCVFTPPEPKPVFDNQLPKIIKNVSCPPSFKCNGKEQCHLLSNGLMYCDNPIGYYERVGFIKDNETGDYCKNSTVGKICMVGRGNDTEPSPIPPTDKSVGILGE